MIDLHSHLLPGIDDGASNVEVALAMARIAVDDGITHMACTPHIYPGLYENRGHDIKLRVKSLQVQLREAGIPLSLTYGADAHVTPELVQHLKSGHVPTLGGSRYFLLEPPHHVAPKGLEQLVFDVLAQGYVPIITHPERLSWIKGHYASLVQMARGGAWLQITAGSITGRFGRTARYWAQRMLEEGLVHVIATDAHGVERRPPLLAEGRDAASRWVGVEEAKMLVEERPLAVLANRAPHELASPPGLYAKKRRQQGIVPRLIQRAFH